MQDTEKSGEILLKDFRAVEQKEQRMRLLEVQMRRLQRRIDRLTPRSNRLSWLRVFIFFGGLGISVVLLFVVGWWLALPLAVLTLLAFGIVAHYHSRIDSSLARHALWRHIKAAHVARMTLDWAYIPPVYTEPASGSHPFEIDLDISGPRSLHQLLNTAISREGSLRLRSWLLATTPDLSTIQQRQALVRELAPLTRFRDRLILKSLLASGRVSEELEGKRLLNWLQQQEVSSALLPLLWVSTALNVLTFLLLVLMFVLHIPQYWTFSLAAAVLLFFATGNLRGDVFADANYLTYGFATLSSIFAYLETYPYGNHRLLKALCEPFFRDRAQGPSRLLNRTARISSLATLKNNPLLWLIVNAFVPWDLACAYQLGRDKRRIAARLPTWLDTWFELEALCSLAAFAYLNPEYVLPAVAVCGQSESENCALFDARDLGHPLLPLEKKVTNTFSLSTLGEVVIITGSNMAGKSTFLRTLGVNLCLAYAGGPVNASFLQTSLFRLFTCIRVTDSVTDGYSYFYAEVKRLRALLTALEQPGELPLFFLIDEIFKGTNNRERLIGSRSYVRAVVGKNCVGAISTHDLELVRLADSLPQVKNVHFREEVTAGRLVFDYVLRSGPCPTTNALKIMELEGLPVEDQP